MGGGDMVSGAPVTAVSGGLITGPELQTVVAAAIKAAVLGQVRVVGAAVPSWGLGPAGYDVRLCRLSVRQFGAVTYSKDGPTISDPPNPLEIIDPMANTHGPYISLPQATDDNGRDYVFIGRHAVVRAETVERFDIPDDVLILPVGKSTYTRHGLALLATPFEPGWRGFPQVTLVNMTDRPIKYYLGGGGMQCLFFRVAGATAYTGRYQDQQPTQPDGQSA